MGLRHPVSTVSCTNYAHYCDCYMRSCASVVLEQRTPFFLRVFFAEDIWKSAKRDCDVSLCKNAAMNNVSNKKFFVISKLTGEDSYLVRCQCAIRNCVGIELVLGDSYLTNLMRYE